jgi:hypothetical protein
MTLRTLWARLFARNSSPISRRARRTRLLLEALEDRCVPTMLTPATFTDGVLGSGSLRDAVLQFNADTGTGDDTINLLAGTYALTIRNTGGQHETAGLQGDLNITNTSHRLIIQGAGSSGPNATIIDASQLLDRVFDIVNPGTVVVFQNLVITGGLAQDDGSNGALAGSTDALGGGILNNGGNITLDNVVLTENVARGGDAAVLYAPGNDARGGGIYSTGGALTMAGATIANNHAIGGQGGDGFGTTSGGTGGTGGTAQGGGLYVNGGSLTIGTSTIASNQGTGGAGGFAGLPGFGLGGGLYNSGTLMVSNSTLSGNSAGFGGGIANGGTLTVSDSTLSSNSVSGSADDRAYGGGLYNFATAMVSNSTLSGNSAPFGGGIVNSSTSSYSHGTLTVSNSTLSGNSATHDAGGILNIEDYSTVTVSNSTLSGNSANAGGGIENVGGNVGGTLTVSNSTLSGNSANAGAGIFNSGTLTVSNSTLSGNAATYSGGGISNTVSGTLTVSNSTLSGNTGGGIDNAGTLTVSNSTLSGNAGGGISSESRFGDPVTLTNVTLTANRAYYAGGGLDVGSGPPVLHNTLIAGNFRGLTGTTRDDVYGALNAGGDYNLIGDGTGMTGLSNGVNGNLIGSAAAPIDPLLGPLQDNGGPTKTHALLAGSPALDVGDPAQLGVADQRGVVRTGGVNIGAYQASASAFVVTVSGTVTASTPFDVTVQAVDVFGQVAFGYRGTVSFSVTDPDPAVVLPLDYTFTADDPRTHTFTGGFTLITPGPWTLTIADLADGLSIDVTLTVNP